MFVFSSTKMLQLQLHKIVLHKKGILKKGYK